MVGAALAEVPTASEAAMYPVPPAATAAPSGQVPAEVTTVPPHDLPVVADPRAWVAAAAVAVAAEEAGVANEKP